MKRFFSVLMAVCTVAFITACAEKSAYESLNPDKQKIVDTVLLHRDRWSDCDTIKFVEYDGKMFFITNYHSKDSRDDKFITALRTEDIKYYIVADLSFAEDKDGTLSFSTALMGLMYDWDNQLDDVQKKEVVSVAMMNCQVQKYVVK